MRNFTSINGQHRCFLYIIPLMFLAALVLYFNPGVRWRALESIDSQDESQNEQQLKSLLEFDHLLVKQMADIQQTTEYEYRSWSIQFHTKPPLQSIFTTALGLPAKNKNDAVTSKVRGGKQWETKQTEIAMNILAECTRTEPQCTFLDIGGNIGWYSLLIAAAGYKTITFEPMPSNFHTILKSMTLQANKGSAIPNIKLYPYGASSKYEQVEIWSSERNTFNGIVVNDITEKGEKESKRADVMLVPVQDFVKEPIYLAKLDIEGYEPFALDGMINLINGPGIKYLMLEVNYVFLKRRGYTNKTFLQKINNLGYQCVKNVNYQNLAAGIFENADAFPNKNTDFLILCKHSKFL